MKKLLIFLLSALTVISFCTSCSNNKNGYEYAEEEWLDVPFIYGEYVYDDAKPLINDFNGEKFASRNITADGYYSGYEKLSNNSDVIYCEDDGSIIWSGLCDSFTYGTPLYGLMRLKKDGTAERICIAEACRKNLEEPCLHMSMYHNNIRYSDGILYMAVFNSHVVETFGGSSDGASYEETVDYRDENRDEKVKELEKHRSYILMYDIKTQKIQKLIDADFPDDGEDWCFEAVNINGRYIYLLHRLLYGGEEKIIRVDLYDENASILIYDYSEVEKAGSVNDWVFYKENIYTSDEDVIYRWDLDMTSCTPIVQCDGSNVVLRQIYGDNLYYFKYPKSAAPGSTQYELYRYNLKAYGETEPVLLHDNIRDMYIDGDIMYYSLYEKHDAFVYLGVDPTRDERERERASDIVTHRVYNGNEILAVPLDLARPSGSWSGIYSAYKPQGSDILGESGFYVMDGYIYTDIYVERQDLFEINKTRLYRASVRVKPVSNRTDYIFYEEWTQFISPFETEKTD